MLSKLTVPHKELVTCISKWDYAEKYLNFQPDAIRNTFLILDIVEALNFYLQDEGAMINVVIDGSRADSDEGYEFIYILLDEDIRLCTPYQCESSFSTNLKSYDGMADLASQILSRINDLIDRMNYLYEQQ